MSLPSPAGSGWGVDFNSGDTFGGFSRSSQSRIPDFKASEPRCARAVPAHPGAVRGAGAVRQPKAEPRGCRRARGERGERESTLSILSSKPRGSFSSRRRCSGHGDPGVPGSPKLRSLPHRRPPAPSPPAFSTGGKFRPCFVPTSATGPGPEGTVRAGGGGGGIGRRGELFPTYLFI